MLCVRAVLLRASSSTTQPCGTNRRDKTSAQYTEACSPSQSFSGRCAAGMRFNHRVLARHLYHASCVEGHLRVTPTSPLRVYPALSATLTAGFANIPVLSGSRLSSNAAPIGRGPKLIASSEHSDTTEDDLKDARRVARDVLGIDRLRPEQEAVISRILGGQNSMIVGPAGSGRSLGYVVCNTLMQSATTHSLSFAEISYSRYPLW